MEKLAFQDLRLFKRLAAVGNLSAVARESGVPASQVSRGLARIEKVCGARLIHRSTHGLRLTAEGETFLGYCERIGAAMEELEGEFAAQAAEASGLVRVAASSVIAEQLLLPGLAGLAARHPRLRVALIVSDQITDLARDGIDIAIRTSASLPDNCVARKLGHLGRALYASVAYAAQAGLPRHPNDLAQHRLITNSAATHLNRWSFEVGGEPVRYVAEGHWQSNDTRMAVGMVLQGLGIGRLATLVADPLVRAGQLVPVLPECLDDAPMSVYAVMASARQRLPKIRACLDFWSNSAGALN